MEQKRIQFDNRKAFRVWLKANHDTCPGIWLVFGKPGGPKTVKAAEALEEALCFGWIDGQMQSLDQTVYIKYFAPRRKTSRWSEKNRGIAQKLQKNGQMTPAGEAAIAIAKQNDMWETPKPPAATPEEIEQFKQMLAGHEPAYTNFSAMSPSVQRTYTLHYRSAKSEDTRQRRLEKILERLDANKKPM